VGGSWGLLDASLAPKFPLTGSIDRSAAAKLRLNAIYAGAGLLLLVGLFARTWPFGLAALGAAGAVSGLLLVEHWTYAQLASRNAFEWALHAVLGAAAAAIAYHIARALAAWIDGRAPAPVPAPAWTVAHWFATDRSDYGERARWLGLLRFVFLVGAAVLGTLLAFDPRYRDFPLALYALPFVGLALLRVGSGPLAVGAEERVIVTILAVTVPVVLFREGFANPAALAWCALCVLGAAPVLAGQRERGDDERERGGLEVVEHEARARAD
jgi:hypothetical protein